MEMRREAGSFIPPGLNFEKSDIDVLVVPLMNPLIFGLRPDRD